jgi:hypothetical protein
MWRTPLIPALRRQRQADFEFEASLVYRVSSRTARAIQRNLVSKKPKKKKKKKKKKVCFYDTMYFSPTIYFVVKVILNKQNSQCSETDVTLPSPLSNWLHP